MALAKRAKILSDQQQATALAIISQKGRYIERDTVIFLLSVKAGLRAKEIASVTWSMLTDAEGRIAESISLENRASKGRHGGRVIPINKHLRQALERLLASLPAKPAAESAVIRSERGMKATIGAAMTPGAIADWFGDLYRSIGFEGCSSHSGRRTFVTRAAQKITQAGGSLRDVQQLAGHASLATTEVYIDGDNAAQKRVVDLV